VRDRDPGLRERIVRYRADPALPREEAAARTSAYVYGNILVFAAMLALTEEDVHHAHAVLVVLGAAACTFLAHVFSEVIGRGMRSDQAMTRADLLHELRDSNPIVTSALFPGLLLTLGALDWLPAGAVLIASDVYLFVRMALIGLIIERLRGGRASPRMLLAGLAIAVLAAAIALLKVTISH
jgi:hypothetical protein